MKTYLLNYLFGPIPDRIAENSNHVLRGFIVWLVAATSIIFFMLLRLNCNVVIGGITFLVVAGASLAGGSAIGFLFGFPKAEKYRFNKLTNDDPTVKTNSYSDNTNLEEVSDWLTKIIVGLTLIKLNTLISWMDQAAKSIAKVYSCNCGTECLSFYVFAYCVIIIYFFAGGGIFYVWARTNLSIMFVRAREKQLEDEKTKLIKQVQSFANTEETALKRNDLVAENETTPTDSFKNTTENIYNSKKIAFKDDLQKERWGGKPLRDEKILEAIYNSIGSLPGLASVKLKVRSTNPNQPLTGQVAFFLHDTFISEIRYTRAVNGMAEINLMVWEAFVAGARTEDGTELELDLNTVKGFPDDFYWRD